MASSRTEERKKLRTHTTSVSRSILDTWRSATNCYNCCQTASPATNTNQCGEDQLDRRRRSATKDKEANKMKKTNKKRKTTKKKKTHKKKTKRDEREKEEDETQRLLPYTVWANQAAATAATTAIEPLLLLACEIAVKALQVTPLSAHSVLRRRSSPLVEDASCFAYCRLGNRYNSECAKE